MLEALWQKNIQSEINPLQYFESIENSIPIPEINTDEFRTITSFDKFVNLSGNRHRQAEIARIIPIFKGEDGQLVQNYRPIPVLPFYSKIVATYVIEFLEDNSVFCDYQFGLRKSHSTSHAIITVVERVSKALDMGI